MHFCQQSNGEDTVRGSLLHLEALWISLLCDNTRMKVQCEWESLVDSI